MYKRGDLIKFVSYNSVKPEIVTGIILDKIFPTSDDHYEVLWNNKKVAIKRMDKILKEYAYKNDNVDYILSSFNVESWKKTNPK